MDGSDVPLRLAEDFPPASREDWLKLVDKTLAGAPFEDKLVSTTADGLRIEPLYTAADTAIGLAPTRRPRDPERSWDIRVLINHPDPVAANASEIQ